MGRPDQDPFLLDTVSALIGCQGLRDFARVLTRELARRFPACVAGLYLYSEETHAFAPAADILLDPASIGYQVAQLPAAGTMKEAAVQSGRAILCGDLTGSPWTEAPWLRAAGLASNLVAPLLLRREARDSAQPIGVMFAGSSSPAAFTEDDRRLMEALATRTAPVLETVLAAEERNALMAITSRIIVGSVTMESLVPTIRDTLQQVIPHDATGLIRFTSGAEGPWFEILHMAGTDIDLTALRQFPFERMAPAELLQTGRPILMTGHNQAHFPESAYIESRGILSAMLCPLVVRGAPYGFLAIGSRRRNAFSERDLRLAEQIGHHLSQALANLVAYEEIRRLKDQLELENVYLRDEISASVDFKELVGESAALQKTLKTIEKVAPTDSMVLITGETGTGKELVAQAIHRLSPRKQQPYITVNCAALPPSLVESELFGHEKGAFTNAVARKIGRFELANRGTIFLDEIGEIPLDIQVKLLRVLETQELERVGGSQTIRLDVRVLAATNADLEQAVAAGTFRADLYYRLKVFPIRIPPLRERRDDIPMLARHFVKKYSARHHRTVTRIAVAAMKLLTTYDWPGNVRELEHLIERAVILAQGPVLTGEQLESEFGLHATDVAPKAPRTLAEAERAHILDVLSQTNWVLAGRNGAAARLGMKRSTLQHRMKKLGIRKPAPAHL